MGQSTNYNRVVKSIADNYRNNHRGEWLWVGHNGLVTLLLVKVSLDMGVNVHDIPFVHPRSRNGDIKLLLFHLCMLKSLIMSADRVKRVPVDFKVWIRG